MINLVEKVLQQICGLNDTKPIIVGVSGGADSSTLIHILVKKYPVIVAHFNHLLRAEASEDAKIVEALAESLKAPFVLGVGSTTDFAQEQNLSVEEAARNLRYRFLFEQAIENEAQAVAVAHNADDQVETVLMHLLRGAGLDGLTGMRYCTIPNPWSESIPLVRPLVGTWRSDIEAYCTKNELDTIFDQTNSDTNLFRNRLRYELIPELETYVPGLRTRLLQTSDLLGADRDVLDRLTEVTWAEIVAQTGSAYTAFHLAAFRLKPLSLQRRLVRKAISLLRPGARDLDFSMVQHVINFAIQPTSTGQVDIGLGLRGSIEDDHLLIAAWEADLPFFDWPQISDNGYLNIPGKLDLENGWIFKAEIPLEVETAQRKARKNRDPYQTWIDLGDQQPPLIIRVRLRGERFQPLGMGGESMKISDFMINQKIPQRARDGWPLVCTGDEIMWVPGYRLDHRFRILDDSEKIVQISLLKK